MFERHELRGSLDPSLEVVLRLQAAAFGRHQPEHDVLVVRHIAERLEAAGANVVVLEKESIDAELTEERFGNEVVAAFRHP